MAPNSAQQHFTSADVSPSARRDFLMEIPYADTATTGHGPTGQNIATEVEYYYPCKRRTPQHFTSADVSLSKRRNFFIEILYSDVATT